MYMRGTFRTLTRHLHAYDSYLKPKLDAIMASDALDIEKVDRMYWLRHRDPVVVGSRVPVIRDGCVTGFCWGWQYDERMGLPGPSETRLESDALVLSALAAA